MIGEAADGEETCQLYDKLLPDLLLFELKAEHALVLHNFERASTEVVKMWFPGK